MTLLYLLRGVGLQLSAENTGSTADEGRSEGQRLKTAAHRKLDHGNRDRHFFTNQKSEQKEKKRKDLGECRLLPNELQD